MSNFFSPLMAVFVYAGVLLLPLGWFYWLWAAIKVGGFFMFLFALFPITAPFSAVLGAWSMLFGIPDWAQSVFIH